MELLSLKQPNRLLLTSVLSTISRLAVTLDPLNCRRCALFHALLERISQRKMVTSVTHRNTLMFRDLGSTPRMQLSRQFAYSQKWP